MSEYAAEIDADGIVLRVIVGDASWATVALGGVWVDSVDLVGIGWFWDGQSFIPPPEPDPDLPNP